MELTNTNEIKATETTKPVQTREEKLRAKYDFLVARIIKDQEAVNEIAAELNNAAALAAVDVGSVVTVKLGRKFADKDTTRFEQATVVGVKVEEDGTKLYKVQYGTGFDADVAVVGASAISIQA